MECKCCNRKNLTQDDFYWRKGLGIVAYSDCKVCVNESNKKKYHRKSFSKSLYFNVDQFAKYYTY